jgi:hypothetical protein
MGPPIDMSSFVSSYDDDIDIVTEILKLAKDYHWEVGDNNLKNFVEWTMRKEK